MVQFGRNAVVWPWDISIYITMHNEVVMSVVVVGGGGGSGGGGGDGGGGGSGGGGSGDGGGGSGWFKYIVGSYVTRFG